MFEQLHSCVLTSDYTELYDKLLWFDLHDGVDCKNINIQTPSQLTQNHLITDQLTRLLKVSHVPHHLVPWLTAYSDCFSLLIFSGDLDTSLNGSLVLPRWPPKPLFESWPVFRGSTGRRSVQGGRQATTRVSAVEAPCFTALTSPSAFCACSSFQPQFMSAICRGRFMLVQVPNKSTLFGPMQTDPASIREKLFTGIDGEYNVRLLKKIFFF